MIISQESIVITCPHDTGLVDRDIVTSLITVIIHVIIIVIITIIIAIMITCPHDTVPIDREGRCRHKHWDWQRPPSMLPPSWLSTSCCWRRAKIKNQDQWSRSSFRPCQCSSCLDYEHGVVHWSRSVKIEFWSMIKIGLHFQHLGDLSREWCCLFCSVWPITIFHLPSEQVSFYSFSDQSDGKVVNLINIGQILTISCWAQFSSYAICFILEPKVFPSVSKFIYWLWSVSSSKAHIFLFWKFWRFNFFKRSSWPGCCSGLK